MFYTICSYIANYNTKKKNVELLERTRTEKINLLEPILTNFKTQEILSYPISYEAIVERLELDIKFAPTQERRNLMSMLIIAYRKVLYIDRQIEDVGIRRQQAMKRKYICLSYFKHKKCKFGNMCKFPHISNENDAKLYICKNGDKCVYPNCIFKHETIIEREDRRDAEEPEDCETKCVICYTDVLQTKKRFGLLSNCDHIFCLNCIKKCRSESTISIQNRLQCPYCRIKSRYVLPSNFYLTGYKKQEALNNFIEKRKTIKCIHGNNCNRITKCPYKH